MEHIKSEIFFTEVHSNDNDKLSLPQLTKTPKTASTLKNLKFTNSKIKSATSSSINLSRRRLTSPSDQTQETFDSRYQRFRADITERAKTNTFSVKHSEIDSKIMTDVHNIERMVALKQKNFNKIRHEVQQKMETLERAKMELGNLKKENLSFLIGMMEKRKNELKEIQFALYNERYYKETLDFVFCQKKLDLPEQEKGVVGVREDLRLKKKELSDLKNEGERDKQEIRDLEKLAESLKEEIKFSRDQYETTYKKTVEIFSQKAKLKQKIEQEHELNKKNYKQKIIEKKIKEVKMDLAAFEKKESCELEKKKMEDHNNFVEEEYKNIKTKGVSNRPEELREEYEELKIKKENLGKDKEQSIDKIEMLTAEWKKLNKELNEVVLNHEADRRINHREFERIEMNLKEKNKQMNENEKILNNLEFVISAICGSVSRIGILLDEDKSYVKPRQLKKHFDYFITGIEKKINFISQYNFTEEKMREVSAYFPNFASIYCINKSQDYF